MWNKAKIDVERATIQYNKICIPQYYGLRVQCQWANMVGIFIITISPHNQQSTIHHSVRVLQLHQQSVAAFHLVSAFVPSFKACVRTSPGRMRLKEKNFISIQSSDVKTNLVAVWISRSESVAFLLLILQSTLASLAMRWKMSSVNELSTAIACLEMPNSWCTLLSAL